MNEGRLVSDVAANSPLHNAIGELVGKLHSWCGVVASEPKPETNALTRSLKRLFRKGTDGTA